jgi:hypothetical protein
LFLVLFCLGLRGAELIKDTLHVLVRPIIFSVLLLLSLGVDVTQETFLHIVYLLQLSLGIDYPFRRFFRILKKRSTYRLFEMLIGCGLKFKKVCNTSKGALVPWFDIIR